MSTIITISGTPVVIPTSGESPNWASAVDTALQLLAIAVNASIGPFDVPPQNFDISTQNPSVGPVNVTNLSFSTGAVRAAFIRYSVYRNTSSTTVVEAGNIIVSYNPTNPASNLWEITNVHQGNASTTFSITDAGQVQITTLALGGTGHNGKIFFAAQALLQ